MGHHHLKKGLIRIKNTLKSLVKKLISRKFITALAGVLGGLAVALGADAGEVETLSGAVLAAVSALGYIITEGRVDAAAVECQTQPASTNQKEDGDAQSLH